MQELRVQVGTFHVSTSTGHGMGWDGMGWDDSLTGPYPYRVDSFFSRVGSGPLESPVHRACGFVPTSKPNILTAMLF